jgi:hypothetical protein
VKPLTEKNPPPATATADEKKGKRKHYGCNAGGLTSWDPDGDCAGAYYDAADLDDTSGADYIPDSSSVGIKAEAQPKLTTTRGTRRRIPAVVDLERRLDVKRAKHDEEAWGLEEKCALPLSLSTCQLDGGNVASANKTGLRRGG